MDGDIHLPITPCMHNTAIQTHTFASLAAGFKPQPLNPGALPPRSQRPPVPRQNDMATMVSVPCTTFYPALQPRSAGRRPAVIAARLFSRPDHGNQPSPPAVSRGPISASVLPSSLARPRAAAAAAAEAEAEGRHRTGAQAAQYRHRHHQQNQSRERPSNARDNPVSAGSRSPVLPLTPSSALIFGPTSQQFTHTAVPHLLWMAGPLWFPATRCTIKPPPKRVLLVAVQPAPHSWRYLSPPSAEGTRRLYPGD